MSEGNQVQVTTNAVYDIREVANKIDLMREQLIRMDERMNMVQDHEIRLRTIEQFNVADHGGRIGALEKWRYALPASLVLAIGSIGASLLQLLGK
jgi:hypothetical protein